MVVVVSIVVATIISTAVMMSMVVGQIVSHTTTNTIPEVICIHVVNVTASIGANCSGLQMVVSNARTLMPRAAIRDARNPLTTTMPSD